MEYVEQLKVLPGYKDLLRSRFMKLKEARKHRITQGAVARALKVEPSYLSRCLTSPLHHPSRDLLFRLTRRLEMSPLECEIVLTHYDFELATCEEHREHLREKLRSAKVYEQFRGVQSLNVWIDTLMLNLNELRTVLAVRGLDGKNLTG